MMNGVLIIDKSAGPTSHDVVASVRRVLRMKKVGHTGTLDPAATGVLPIVLGKATKLSRYLVGCDKSYRGVITLGVTTDTLDAVGEVLEEKPVDVTEEQVEAALEQFRGDIKQVPPMYSAKKIDGKKLYELARQGVEVEREAKDVRIDELKLVSFDGTDIVVDVTCTSGTYIRVLALDIGEVLGCGGHLSALRRTRVGSFDLSSAITIDDLADEPQKAQELALSMGDALVSLPAIEIPADIGAMIKNGYQLTVADLKTLDLPEFKEDDALMLRTLQGDLIAVARSLYASESLSATRREKQALKTERVLA
jgi:tRNA pseudouridine55 synthase